MGPPAECCEMELAQPCFIRGMVGPRNLCAVACQLRFKQLSWDCYTNYHISAQWHTMQTNCDPQKLVSFQPPAINATSPQKADDGRASTSDNNSHVRLLVGIVVVFATVTVCTVVA